MTTSAMAVAIGTIVAIVIAIVIALIFLLIFVIAFCRTRIYDDTNIRKRVLQTDYGAIGQSLETTTLVQQPMVIAQPVVRQVCQPLPPLPAPQCQAICHPVAEPICLPAAPCSPPPSRCVAALDLAAPTPCNPCGAGNAAVFNACSRPVAVGAFRTGGASPAACAPAALTSVVPVTGCSNGFRTTYVASNNC